MPTYDYRCKKCGTVFEIRHGFDEKPPKTCKVKGCRGRLERLFSPPAIIFKGQGWYVTDNARGNGNGKDKRGGNGSDPDKLAKTMEKSGEKAADKAEKKTADKTVSKAESKTAEKKTA